VFLHNFKGVFEIARQRAARSAMRKFKPIFLENPESLRDFLVERIFRFSGRFFMKFTASLNRLNEIQTYFEESSE